MNNKNLNSPLVCLPLVLLLLGFPPPAHAADVPRSPEDVRPLLVGQKIPSAQLRTLDGKKKDLKAAVRGAYTVLVFYRGGWCPFCNIHLSALGAAKRRLAELGWSMVAVSPDRPAELKKSKSKHQIDYALYSDSDMAAARAMGLAFRVDSATLKKYKKYGIDLTQASGRTHNELPVPAVYLVAPDGTVQFQYANPNYKVRLDHRVLLAAAEAYGPKRR